MRIATHTLFDQGVSNILGQQTALALIQQQISNGKRMQTAADDPAGWGMGLSLEQSIADTGRYQNNVATVRQRLGLEENALASSTGVIARVRELAIQANSGIQSPQSRQAIASELVQLKEQLLSYANTQDVNGSYLFAGSNSASAAFSKSGSSVIYNGDQNQRLLEIGAGRNMADGDTGASVYLDSKSGNGTFAVSAAGANTGDVQVSSNNVLDRSLWDGGTYAITFNAGNYQVTDSSNFVIASGSYSAGSGIRFRGIEVTLTGQPANGDQVTVGPSQQKDVFAMLDDLIGMVQNPGTTGAQRAQMQTTLFRVQQELSGAFDQMNNIRATVGTRMSALDDADNGLSQHAVTVQKALSSVTDLDIAKASTQLSMHSLMLQAAQLAFSKVQGLSLFQYLR